jgi:hypothetical protein
MEESTSENMERVGLVVEFILFLTEIVTWEDGETINFQEKECISMLMDNNTKVNLWRGRNMVGELTIIEVEQLTKVSGKKIGNMALGFIPTQADRNMREIG